MLGRVGGRVLGRMEGQATGEGLLSRPQPRPSVYSSSVVVCESQAISRHTYRLVGLVVKASASRAEDPGYESRLRRDFSGVESYQ